MAKTSRTSRPLSHRIWFRIVVLVLFFMPAYAEFGYDPSLTTDVVRDVLQNPYIESVPQVLPLAKVMLLIVVLLAFFGMPNATRVLLGYYVINLIAVAIFQNMATTDRFGFVWLIGNTVVQLIVIGWSLADMRAGHTAVEPGQLRTGRLWLLIPMVTAFLMPYAVSDGQIVPSMNTVLWNEAGVTYCMVTPVILGVLLLFPETVDRRTLAVIAYVGFLFGVMNMIVWFGLNPQDWWMGVLHLPLVITSVYGLIESRGAKTWGTIEKS